MAAHDGQPLVQVTAELGHFAIVLRQCLLPPGVGDSREQRDEGNRAGQEHALLQPVLDQPEIVLQRRAEERLAGEEHHDHLR